MSVARPLPPPIASTTPGVGLQFRFASNHELLTLLPRWESLVNHCSWSNPCYEPEFLLAALRTLDDGAVQVLVAERNDRLVGLLPIVTKSLGPIPLRIAQAWRPEVAFDSTPLIDAECVVEVLEGILQTLRDVGHRMLDFNTVSGEPAFDLALFEAARRGSLNVFRRDRFQRAALRPQGTAEDYFPRVLSKNRRKKLSRALRGLESLGEISFETAQSDFQAREWMETFLDIEASGWKGNASTAFASEDETFRFFVDVVGRLIDSQKLDLSRLTVNSVPIAMLVDVRSNGHVACYKTAFDERYAEYSPGTLLERYNVERMHESGIELCDSCGDPDNELLNTLYEDRLTFQHLIVGLDRCGSTLTGLILPQLQSLSRFVRRLRGRS
ncbi:GNAT family N-acetyltransferase [Roseiconus lacunae]|uniref:GNAT family N-acetyltransferase n=1 Tax=Roseiconus lacunae TaxID=2605694 RepID=UPI0011F18607|nr:GNAT family N-acetyltransferase [Roseiconus lacunae]